MVLGRYLVFAHLDLRIRDSCAIPGRAIRALRALNRPELYWS